jgi:hypothetical protein
MPTVLIINGFRFHFYASDRDEPPHIHVTKGEGYAKIWLEPKVDAQYFYQYKTREKREILKIIAEH